CGHADAVDDAGAGDAVVVVVGVTEAAIGRDDLVVELANRADGPEAGKPVNLRKQLCLAANAAHKIAEKMPFVGAVGRLMQSIGAGREIDDWADGGNGRERRAVSPLPCQLEHQVAAHRVAYKRDTLQAMQRRKILDHCAYIRRAARVVESGCERLRIAAVAHVHTDNVHASSPRARSDAADVTGV